MTFGQTEDDKEMDLDDLLDEGYAYVEPVRGDIRNAIILLIDKTEIVVDLGVKRDGIIPQRDLERLSPDYLASLKVGDEVPVYVLNPSDRSGNLIVSLNLGLQGQDWVNAKKLLESGEMVETEVIGHNKGGVLVRFGRLEGFVPASHLADVSQGLTGPERRSAMDEMVGQVIGVKVIEVNQSRRRLILSQREAQREWRAQQKKRLLEGLNEGDRIKGRVTGIRDFGVFVNIGGADGLIHVSELAWHRVPHPSDVLRVGDEIEVYVLELDHEKQRIALSLRHLLPDPWSIVTENHHVGEIVEGAVSNVVDFGAFVVLDDGIEGLLHVTEMGDGSLKEPHSYLKRGDHVMMRIVRIESDRKRIGFSQRGLELELPTDRLQAESPDEQAEEPVDIEEPPLDEQTEEPVDIEEIPLDEQTEEPPEIEEPPLDEQTEEPPEIEEPPLDEQTEEPVDIEEPPLDEQTEEPVDIEEPPLDEQTEEPVDIEEPPLDEQAEGSADVEEIPPDGQTAEPPEIEEESWPEEPAAPAPSDNQEVSLEEESGAAEDDSV
jgi:small subunit ribosomal protein S1